MLLVSPVATQIEMVFDRLGRYRMDGRDRTFSSNSCFYSDRLEFTHMRAKARKQGEYRRLWRKIVANVNCSMRKSNLPVDISSSVESSSIAAAMLSR